MLQLRNRLLPTATTFIVLALAALAAAPICAARPGGGGPRVISFESQPSWTRGPEIRTMDENGGNAFVVSNDRDVAFGGWARWTPDGQRLGLYYKVLRDANRNVVDRALMSIRADGTDERMLLKDSEFQQATGNSHDRMGLAAWGPPGDPRIVFEGGTGLYLLDTQTEAITLLVDGLRQEDTGGWVWDYIAEPHWSWTLNQIVFVFVRGGNGYDLWTVQPDGSGLRQISSFGGALDFLRHPIWSPDGTRIAFQGGPGATDLYVADLDASQTITGVQPVAADPNALEGMPAWSPDGTQLVYVREYFQRPADRYQVVIHNLETATERVIVDTTRVTQILFPDWKPAP